jgi:hypothetical protein
MAVSVFRAHAAHFVVFGLPVVALLASVGWQEARARLRMRAGAVADLAEPPPEPGSVGLRTAAWGLAVAALIHAFVIPAHFHAFVLYGVFFTVLALAQVACAGWIARHPSRRFVLAVAISSACVVVLWIVSRTTGLPVGPTPWHREGFGAADEISSAVEALAAWGCWIALHPQPMRHRVTGPRTAAPL